MYGFLYVACDEVERSGDPSRHHKLARLYAPDNWVDYQFVGGEQPRRGITWKLD
jgi:hypothetical protein